MATRTSKPTGSDVAELAEALGMTPDDGPDYFLIERRDRAVPLPEGMGDVTIAHKVAPDDWHKRAARTVKLFVVGEVGHADAVDAVVALTEVGPDESSIRKTGWAMRVRFVPVEDGAQVVDVQLRPTDGDAGLVGAKMLRGLGFGAVMDEAERAMRDAVVASAFLGDRWPGPVKRPGRGGKSDAGFVRMAKRYVEALEVAPRSPIKRIVDDLHAEGVRLATIDEVRAQVNEAKNRGLLTRGKPGVAGGEWTEKGRHLLAQMGLEA